MVFDMGSVLFGIGFVVVIFEIWGEVFGIGVMLYCVMLIFIVV